MKFDEIAQRVGLNTKTKTFKSKETCERLLMKLVLEGYLEEVSEQNTMGFSNDHLEVRRHTACSRYRATPNLTSPNLTLTYPNPNLTLTLH